MNKAQLMVASAMIATFSLPLLASAGPAPTPKFEHEKCFGITKAGKNDCQTANSSCAGTSKRDKQGDAWIYVPKGTCDRVVEGSLQAKN
ncbi:MAG TPA: DUF2282 domain-containing protein [Methylomirabilota bacterium]|nr:DUF2282 domain-containing protein [Methylomirabilota bacterium]